ncbi:uncharacterized protein FA14DRAFT_187012 [Meira miltonrushii]|uniref:RlpA-like protein double-psi beta-barrel domain-containing protein n=1 Tax=Meira miltonrushii TaxID=1280837 RepID=A0A316VLA1_9BASI|nr:uncharacterized protein FA14DRAFT_187012 [Meira miltonrushii]PWN36851.1 hypothetical protein FA14DRAFT_187012 [Meira miltonrushii]
MRLSTIALTLFAVGVSASMATEDLSPRSSAVASRDFERKIQARDPKKHHHKQRGDMLLTDAKFTWYGGGQLDAPACGGPTPNRNDRVVAVPTSSPAKCGDEVHLHHGGKMVKAKVVDYCSGCSDHQFDLTQGTFEALAALEVGELSGAHVRIIPQ